MEKETKKKTTKKATTKGATSTKKVSAAKKSTAKKASTKATAKKSTTKKASTKATAKTTTKTTAKKTGASKKSTNNAAVKVADIKKQSIEAEIKENINIKNEKNKKSDNIIAKENNNPEKNIKKDENFLLANNEGTNLIKIILIIVAILLAIYLLTYIINKGKEPKKADNETTASIQYDNILVNKALSQSKSEYYVLATTNDDEYSNAYETYKNAYSYKEGSLKVYTADLSSGFNSKYVGKESNLYVSNIDEIKFSKSTLIKVIDGQVTEVYEGNQSIIDHLKSLVK